METRSFPMSFEGITMSERRLMASKFGVNWDLVEMNLADMPDIADRENPTREETLAAGRHYMSVVGPNERFALMYIAIKREIPQAPMSEIESKVDAGEWVLDLSGKDSDDQISEGDADPLPPPQPS